MPTGISAWRSGSLNVSGNIACPTAPTAAPSAPPMNTDGPSTPPGAPLPTVSAVATHFASAISDVSVRTNRNEVKNEFYDEDSCAYDTCDGDDNKFDDDDLAGILGFASTTLAAATTHTVTQYPRHIWRPTRGLSGHPVDVKEALAGGILDEIVEEQAVEARAIEKARALAASPASAYEQIKRQLRASVLDKIDRAVNHGEEPLRSGWFSPETTRAALEVLTRER